MYTCTCTSTFLTFYGVQPVYCLIDAPIFNVLNTCMCLYVYSFTYPSIFFSFIHYSFYLLLIDVFQHSLIRPENLEQLIHYVCDEPNSEDEDKVRFK